MSCGGHVISSISRKALLTSCKIAALSLVSISNLATRSIDLDELENYDLLIAADGLNSIIRKKYEVNFKPS